MDSVDEIMQLCRLCLVKDEVNIPIFEEQGDLRQIFLKISACLPVKVSKEDNLPKNICDGCSCKLETLYQFWNTSANSEKKLIKWLSQVDKPVSDKHSMNIDPVILKQEVVEVPDDRHSPDDDLVPDDLNVSNDAEDYLIQQQQLPYQNVEFQFQQEEFDQTGTDANVVEAGPPSRKRRAAAIRAMANMGSEDEDNPDLLEPKIAKTEEESEESCNEDPEPTTFVGLPSATDNEQPGPSGVGKPAADAPKSVKLEPECHGWIASLTQQKRRQKRIWNCAKCCESFDTSRKLRQHRQGHRANENDVQYNYRYDDKRRIYCCLTCDIETVNKDEMEKHVWEHEEKHTCPVCDETFVKPYEYSCHLYNHDQTKGFCCPFCKYTTMRRTAIMIHINTFHLRKFIYNCELCGKGFNDCVLFKEHSNVHEGKRPFRCVVCNKDFAFSSYLTSHQVRYHRVTIDGVLGKNQCYICLKSFTRSTTLEKHIKMHGKKKVHEKRHLCDICGKGFAQIDKWRIHYRVHTGIKPYTCSYCAKSFTKRDYLIMHERVHSGEKPYSCKFCGKCFNQGAPLRLHIRSHTGERPYLCHLCRAGFISRSVLNLHLKNCPGTVQD